MCPSFSTSLYSVGFFWSVILTDSHPSGIAAPGFPDEKWTIPGGSCAAAVRAVANPRIKTERVLPERNIALGCRDTAR